MLYALMGCLAAALAAVAAAEGEAVTCGSVVKLQHLETNYDLHSHSINWGSGSGQQSVTAHGGKDDQGNMWLVKEPHDKPACEAGTPIKCGDIVRLEHLVSHRNLHSHLFRSALSPNQEVSCFGDHGRGDSGDNWKVVCENSKATYWERGQPVKFQHADTNMFLFSSTSNAFTQKNCPNCPILGQYEVSAAKKADKNTRWATGQGIYIQSKQ